MKYILIFCIFVGVTLSQDKCGTWDAVIIKIEKADTSFVVTGMNYMPDCQTPSGVFFEWSTNQFGVCQLTPGMKINFDTWRPAKGYWKYKRMYAEH